MDKEIIKQIEAILFSCGRKIEIEEISKLVGISSNGPIKTALKKIKSEYENRESPLMIVEEGTGWKMTVREKYLVTVRKITPYMEFSKTLMETLAVVAWKQPIIQSDVIRIRTNKAYEHIMELEKMGFLAKEKHGRSFLLKLSQKFYDYFDLRNDVDVRNLFKHVKDTGEDEQKKVDEYNHKQPKQTLENIEGVENQDEQENKEDQESDNLESNDVGAQDKLEEVESVENEPKEIETEISVNEENEPEPNNNIDEIKVEDEITHSIDSKEDKELKVEEEMIESENAEEDKEKED
jgi:segregation and condensation protein B